MAHPPAGLNGAGWFDVSVPIRSGMVQYPGNPPLLMEFVRDLQRGDSETLSRLCLSAHTGTHLDAPSHFVRGGASVDQLPLEALIGAARIVDIPEVEALTAEHLMAHGVASGQRILLRTRNTQRCWSRGAFVADYSHLSVDAAQFIAKTGVRLIGIDYLSIGRGAANPEVHRILLGAGTVILEGLDLSDVTAGWHELICLPMPLAGREGAPARALVRPIAP